MIWPLLTTYWLEALLALGFVLLLTVPFIWLRGLIKIEADNYEGLKAEIGTITSYQETFLPEYFHQVRDDYKDLRSRLDLLDKPSNDRALENIAVILKKKISKQPTKLIRTKAKANGRSHAHR